MDSGITTRIFKPTHPRLHQIVRHFWTMRSAVPVRFKYEILPGSNVNIVLNYAPGQRAFSDQALSRACGLVSSESDTYLSFDICCRLDLLGIMFYSGAARSFLDIQPGEIRGCTDLNAVKPGFSERLMRKTSSLSTTGKRIEVIEQEFVRSLNFGSVPGPAIRHAMTVLSGKSRNIRDFCDSSGINRRTLERGFSHFLGLSPKRLQQAGRIKRAIALLITNRYRDITDLGYACGYYDQAHFIHEFKYFIGRTPGQYGEDLSSAAPQKHDNHVYSISYLEPRSHRPDILIR